MRRVGAAAAEESRPHRRSSIARCCSPRSRRRITSLVGDHGLYAVFVLMLVDAVFPAASELVMLYAGALAGGAFAGRTCRSSAAGRLRLLGLSSPSSLAGTLGYLVGSLLGWAIGVYGGRPLLERHGRWFHLAPEKLDRAERWFERWGDWAVFLGRLTPVVRSFISIPAGVFRMPLGRYTLLTLLGSAIWCFAFAGIGWALGTSYERVPRRLPLGRLRRGRACSCWPRSLAVRPPTGSTRLTRRAAIPLVDVQAQYAPLIPELKERLGDVLDSGQFILGPNVARLRGGGGRLPRRAARDRRRERHRRARARARRDRRSGPATR